MTISSSNSVVSLNADGSTHSFSFNFKIFAASDLKVIVRSAAGVETDQTLNSQYIIADSSVGNASGGNILFKYNTGTSSDAHYSTTDYRPANNTKVILRQNIPRTQTLDLINNSTFDAENIEAALDRIVLQVQGVEEAVNRSFKFSRSNLLDSSGSAIASTYPEIEEDTTARANKILSFDSTGVPIATQEIGTLKGNWAASTVYQERDIVKDTSNNNIYIVNTAHTSSGSQPLSTNGNASKYTVIIDTGANVTLTATGAITGGSLVADNITIDGNTISTTNSDGSLVLTPEGDGQVHVDGEIYVEGNDISQATNFIRIGKTSNGGDDIFMYGVNPWLTISDVSTTDSTPNYGGGTIDFQAKDAGGTTVSTSRILGGVTDRTASSVDGGLRIETAVNSSMETAVTVAGTTVTLAGKLAMPDVTSGKILVADGTSYEEVAVSGDVTMASSGAVTIASGAVENAMLAGSIADSKLSTITTADKVSGAAVQIDGATDGTSITIADTDKFLVDDGGTTKYINASQLNTYTSASVAADDLATGDAAVTIATSSGAITLDTQGANANIVFKGTDDSTDITMLTLNAGEAGAATFNSTVTATGFIIGSADINENDLEAIDGITAGTVAASKVVTVDTNKDFSGARNITLTGELDAGSLDISGNADIAGTTNLDNTDIDGTLVVDGSNISLDSTSTLNIDNSNTSNGITIGTATSGVPVSIGHSTSEVTINDNLNVTGNLVVSGTTTTVNSTTVTIDDPIFTLGGDTAPGSDDNKDRGIEFRYHDGSSARVGFFGYDDSASAFTVFTAATNSSEVFSGTTGNAIFGNVTGTLQTAAQTNITSVGALDGGSITSGFGNINNGSSTITTTGALAAGTASIGGGTIGDYHASADNMLIYSTGNTGMTIASGTSSSGSIYFADGTTDGIAEYMGQVYFNHSNNTLTLTAMHSSSGSASMTVDGENNKITMADNLEVSGTGSFTGALTANAGVVVDNITIDGTEIDLSSGDLTIDVAGDITLDADGGNILFKDGGTEFLEFEQDGGGCTIRVDAANTDLKFVGNDSDGGGAITALTIDMSEGGRVGIGTTSPNNTLDVNGGIVCSPNTDGKDTFELSTNDVNEGRLRIKNVDTTTVQIRAGGDSYFNGGNVAIGTTSPETTFHVNGNVAIKNGSDYSGYFDVDGAATLYHAGSSKIATTSGGVTVTGDITASNITLGTTLEGWGANSHVIQLGDGTVDNGALAWNTISGGDHFDLMYQCYFDGTNFRHSAPNAAASRISQWTGEIRFDRKAGNSTDGATFTWDRSMNIDTSGNIEIKTDGAALKFGADGECSLTHVHNQGLALNSSYLIYFNGTDNYIHGPTANELTLNGNTDLSFDIGTTEYMRLTDSKLSLGRQNETPHFELFYNHSDGNDYKASLQLNGNDLEVRGSNGAMEFYTGAVDGGSSTKRFEILSGGALKAYFSSGNTYILNDGSNDKFYVNANGGIYNYQSNDSNLSDEREKKNISSLGSKWDAVKKWSLKEFHYNADADSDSKKCGVIAQDIEDDHPNLITEFELTEDTTRKAVKEQQMMWMAIKALQEAMEKIETLEEKVAALEGS